MSDREIDNSQGYFYDDLAVLVNVCQSDLGRFLIVGLLLDAVFFVVRHLSPDQDNKKLHNFKKIRDKNNMGISLAEAMLR